MSDIVVAWARRTRVGNASAKSVLVELAIRADVFESQAQVSTATLADVCEISTRTLSNALGRLERLGAITRERQYVDGKRVEDLFTMQIGTRIIAETRSFLPRGLNARSGVRA